MEYTVIIERGERLRYKLYFLYILLGGALVQYQNCAPNSQSLDSSSLSADVSGAGSSVDVIDQVVVGDIAFAQSKVSAELNQNVVVSGVCGQAGSLISWSLLDSSGEVIERGLAECDLGGFDVELSDQWQGYCNQDLTLKAALGAKAETVVTVQALCQ